MRTSILLMILAAAVSADSQVKTVTNADLAKFAEKRLAAEREYRENYAEMGMPSPEELERMYAAEDAERERLSQKFRAERLERERIQAAREAAEAESRRQYAESGRFEYSTVRTEYFPYYYGGYYYPHPVRRRHLHSRDPIFNRHRGSRKRSYYPWMIIRTPRPSPNFFPR